MKLKVPFILTLCLGLAGCFHGSGKWQAELHDKDEKMALTLRLLEKEESKERTVVFEYIHSGVIKPTIYSLPEDAVKIPDAKLTFQDTTLLPGRVTMNVHSHIIDIMPRNIVVDGEDHEWNALEPIIIENPNQSQ